MTSRPSFYITTPIYYVNDRPHVGHAYTTTVCDVMARFHRFLGCEVFFLTGTDEHGQKVQKSAQERGISPQELADRNAAEFQAVLASLNLTTDDFVRTTQPRHIRQVQAFVRRLEATGDLYLGSYEGWYDEGQEEFVPDNRASEQNYLSTVNGKPLIRASEENYFFRLSAFQDRLVALLQERPDFVRPEARRNEVLGRIQAGLADIPVSRTSFTWGIPWPGNEKHVIYVWVDALFNYITALGLGEDEEAARAKFWPAQYHVIGKEILFFHAVIWPALLMALKLPLPECVYAHSFWIRDGRKMSKSLGNFIDLETIQKYVDEFGMDAWRWFMVTQGPLGATDSDFAHEKFVSVYNTDLANTFGNSTSRVTNMIAKYFDGEVPPRGAFAVEGFDWPQSCAQTTRQVITAMRNLELHEAMNAAMSLVRQVDLYIEQTRPFTMAKNEAQRDDLAAVLYNCLEALRIASLLLWATMPQRVADFWSRIGQSIDPTTDRLEMLCEFGTLKPGTAITRGEPLFPRKETAEV